MECVKKDNFVYFSWEKYNNNNISPFSTVNGLNLKGKIIQKKHLLHFLYDGGIKMQWTM